MLAARFDRDPRFRNGCRRPSDRRTRGSRCASRRTPAASSRIPSSAKVRSVIARVGAARAARGGRCRRASTCARCGRAASTRCASWWRPRRPKRATASMRSRIDVDAALARHAGDAMDVPRLRRWRGVSLRGAGRCRPDDAERAIRRHRVHVRRRLRLHGLQHRPRGFQPRRRVRSRSRRAASASTTPTICRWCAARRRTRSRSAKPTCATTAACISAGRGDGRPGVQARVSRRLDDRSLIARAAIGANGAGSPWRVIMLGDELGNTHRVQSHRQSESGSVVRHLVDQAGQDRVGLVVGPVSAAARQGRHRHADDQEATSTSRRARASST